MHAPIPKENVIAQDISIFIFKSVENGIESISVS